MAGWKKVVVESGDNTIDQNTTGTAASWTTARVLELTGAVTGTASIDGSGNVSLATTATSDPTLTLSGDATGSATFTNLGNAELSVTIADDSHNHIISNVDGLQTALDAKQDADADLTAIAALSNADGNFIVGNGTTWVAESAGTARASLGLGALATKSLIATGDITNGTILEADLNISNSPTSGYILSSDGNTGFTWIQNTASANNATITFTAGAGLTFGSGDGIFTLNQSSDESFTLDVDSTVVRTSGAQNIGGNKTFDNDVIVTGSLTVNGATTTVSTTNLLVEDTFIALNSEGQTNVDAGIVFTGAANKVFGWDQSQESGRFGVDYAGGDASVGGGGFSPDAWISTVHTAANPASTGATAALGQIGNIYINSSNSDIYIYA